MTEELDLFSAPTENGEPYKVPGLIACGNAPRGQWEYFWAEAPMPLYSLQDRAAVMAQLGKDPEAYDIQTPAPVDKKEKTWRTCWQAWPKHLPSPNINPKEPQNGDAA